MSEQLMSHLRTQADDPKNGRQNWYQEAWNTITALTAELAESRAERGLLNAALETIDAVFAVADSGMCSPGDMEEVAYIIEQFRIAYPKSHSQMAREAAARPAAPTPTPTEGS